MSTDYGPIKSALGTNVIDIYPNISMDTITLFVHQEGINIGHKVLLHQDNIDDFLSAIQCALQEKNIFSNYLHPDGDYRICK